MLKPHEAPRLPHVPDPVALAGLCLAFLLLVPVVDFAVDVLFALFD